MSTTTQQHFYRSGQVRERVPFQNGRRHGVVRTWHRNSALASEEVFRNGLLHGICRQWDETGRLLGKYRMVHGTGIQRAWHDNGKLQMEVSTVGGEFTGRNRIWLRDGTLISERFYLRGRVVSPQDYRAATAKDKTLPKFRGRPAKLPPDNRATQRHVHQVFVASLLDKENQSEARSWLAKGKSSLARFKRAGSAAKFVEELYGAGAVEVVAPDICSDRAGDQFADGLLVRLPKSAAKRKAIRKVCVQLKQRKLGVVQPDRDVGESHLYLSMA